MVIGIRTLFFIQPDQFMNMHIQISAEKEAISIV